MGWFWSSSKDKDQEKAKPMDATTVEK